jgi:tripartite-type tricarboxylate transporter receptor subunit TctC
MLIATGVAHAQPYPNKPIRIITATAGSGSDVVARMIAQRLTASLGRQVIVDNRGGAGVFPGQLVAQAPFDGYTLLYYSSTHWLLPFLREKAPYDPLKDFSPVTLTVILPNVLVVRPSLPINSVKELIALARSRPGELNYASGGTGSPSHLAGELFKSMAGVNIVQVSYKGAGPVLGNEVPIMFGIVTNVPPHIKSGRLKALAVTSARPSAKLPDLPTMAAAGVPGYEIVSAYAVWAPANTPEPVIARLNREIVQILRRPEVSEPLLNDGIEVVGSTPEELVVYAKGDMARMGKVITDAGIRAQ